MSRRRRATPALVEPHAGAVERAAEALHHARARAQLERDQWSRLDAVQAEHSVGGGNLPSRVSRRRLTQFSLAAPRVPRVWP